MPVDKTGELGARARHTMFRGKRGWHRPIDKEVASCDEGKSRVERMELKWIGYTAASKLSFLSAVG